MRLEHLRHENGVLRSAEARLLQEAEILRRQKNSSDIVLQNLNMIKGPSIYDICSNYFVDLGPPPAFCMPSICSTAALSEARTMLPKSSSWP